MASVQVLPIQDLSSEKAVEDALSSASPDEWGSLIQEMLGASFRPVVTTSSRDARHEAPYTISSLIGLMGSSAATKEQQTDVCQQDVVRPRRRLRGQRASCTAHIREHEEDSRPLEALLKELGEESAEKAKKKATKASIKSPLKVGGEVESKRPQADVKKIQTFVATEVQEEQESVEERDSRTQEEWHTVPSRREAKEKTPPLVSPVATAVKAVSKPSRTPILKAVGTVVSTTKSTQNVGRDTMSTIAPATATSFTHPAQSSVIKPSAPATATNFSHSAQPSVTSFTHPVDVKQLVIGHHSGKQKHTQPTSPEVLTHVQQSSPAKPGNVQQQSQTRTLPDQQAHNPHNKLLAHASTPSTYDIPSTSNDPPYIQPQNPNGPLPDQQAHNPDNTLHTQLSTSIEPSPIQPTYSREPTVSIKIDQKHVEKHMKIYQKHVEQQIKIEKKQMLTVGPTYASIAASKTESSNRARPTPTAAEKKLSFEDTAELRTGEASSDDGLMETATLELRNSRRSLSEGATPKFWLSGLPDDELDTSRPSLPESALQSKASNDTWSLQPSVGTWLGPSPRPRRVSQHEATSNREANAIAWHWRPSVGTWLRPSSRSPSRRQRSPEPDVWPSTPQSTPPESPRTAACDTPSQHVVWMPIPFHLVSEVQSLINMRAWSE